MNTKRWRIVTPAVLLLIGLTGAACGGDDGENSAATTTTASTSTTTAAPSSSTTTAAPSSATTTRAAVPGAVEVVTAGPGGGSGEITLRWNAVANVTGYRVLRANAAGGPFTVDADVNITTGKATAATEVTNIFSSQRTYIPPGATATAPDPSPRFEYVEVGGNVQHYFRVVAYNASGDAPASAVVCGSPPGQPRC